MSQYPKDEFDLAAKDRGPRGAHRRVETGVARYMPFVVLLILGPLLAWGVVSLLNRDGGVEEPSPTASAQETDLPSDASAEPEPTDDATEVATDEPSDEPAPENVNFASGVSVLNGGTVPGLSADVAEKLTDAGFTDVYAGNYLSSLPNVSYVYFQTEDLRETAQYIADQLGIEPIDVLSGASNEIVVVLRSDFNQ